MVLVLKKRDGRLNPEKAQFFVILGTAYTGSLVSCIVELHTFLSKGFAYFSLSPAKGTLIFFSELTQKNPYGHLSLKVHNVEFFC